MRICIFGAGAIGGHLGARAKKGGADVSVVARGAHLAAMQVNGLRVQAPDGEIVAQVTASADPATLGRQDAVIVTVKAPALPAVAAAIAPLLGPDTRVVFAMNGIPWFYFHQHAGELDGTRLPRIDPDGALWREMGPERAIAGIVYSACTVSAPGIIHVEGTSRLILGEPGGAISVATETLAAVLRMGGLDIKLTSDMRQAIWRKLLLNLFTGPLCVIAQSNLNDLIAEPAAEAASRACLAEAVAIARAMGHDITVDPDRLVASMRGMLHKPSVLQDLELGRPMEIDAVFDAPLQLARRMGVATPTLDLVVTLMKLRARAAGLYVG